MNINAVNNTTFGMAKRTDRVDALLRETQRTTNRKDVREAIEDILILHPEETLAITKCNDAPYIGDYVTLTNRHSQCSPLIHLSKLKENDFESNVMQMAAKMRQIDDIRKNGVYFHI